MPTTTLSTPNEPNLGVHNDTMREVAKAAARGETSLEDRDLDPRLQLIGDSNPQSSPKALARRQPCLASDFEETYEEDPS